MHNYIMDVLDSDFYVEVVIKVGGEEVFELMHKLQNYERLLITKLCSNR